MDVIKEQKVGELTVRVYLDEDPWIDPLEDKPEWFEILHWHRRSDWYNTTNASSWDRFEIKEYINDDNIIAYPLFLYEHSMRWFSIGSPVMNCPWDSGQAGFVLIHKKEFMKEWGWKRMTVKRLRKVAQIAKSWLAEWDSWQRGDVYGFITTDENDERVDSCWGFIGDVDYCLKYGVEEANNIWARMERERLEELALFNEELAELEAGQSGDILLGQMVTINWRDKFWDARL